MIGMAFPTQGYLTGFFVDLDGSLVTVNSDNFTDQLVVTDTDLQR
jgi:hypothetical protein